MEVRGCDDHAQRHPRRSARMDQDAISAPSIDERRRLRLPGPGARRVACALRRRAGGKPAYTPDWAERHSAETLRDAARRIDEIAVDDAQPGDVLLFRMHASAHQACRDPR